MVYLLAFALLYAVSAVCWAAAVWLYRAAAEDPRPAGRPHRKRVGRLAAAALAVTGLVPFPAGYLFGLLAGGVAARAGLGLSAGRTAVFVAALAVTTLAARLGVRVLLGV